MERCIGNTSTTHTSIPSTVTCRCGRCNICRLSASEGVLGCYHEPSFSIGHIDHNILHRMTLEASEHSSDDHASSYGNYEPYEASVASTAPSSQASVFSDTLSAQSSIATSISDDFRSSQEDAREQDRICAAAQLQYQVQNNKLPEHSSLPVGGTKVCAPFPSYADVTSVPASYTVHPRRGSLTRSQKPPLLIRQRERKNHFVDNLVGKHYASMF